MAHEWAKGLTAALLLGILVSVALREPSWNSDTPSGIDPLRGIADALFQEPWVFAFELLGLLLLAALFGSLWLSQKEGPEEAEE